jgi:class III poly(R)-hydroxyalkanoic acid synthase PhaE subunit
MLELWAPWARDGRASIDDAVVRMNAQAGDWLGRMQDLAQRFARKQASPADVAKAWQDALGAGGSNPFAAMLAQGTGPGANGVEQWMQQMIPMWESWQAQISGLFNMPAFGPAREQQERWQSLLKARMDYQQSTAAYAALLMGCGKRAFAVFEARLAERSEPGRQIDSARGLFDLWIDSAEEAWAEVALSPEYRRVYGEMTNAQMRVRAGVQDQVERIAGQFGMPTRTEVNSGHRKVTQLEREVRELKQRLAALEANAGKSAAASPAKAAPVARAAAKPVAKAPKAGRTAAKKPALAPHKPIKPAKPVAPRRARK